MAIQCRLDRLEAYSRVKARFAFTLIELVLVMVILAAAMAMAIPALRGYVASSEIIAATQRVELELKKTRLTAIRTGQIQVMRFLLNDRQVSTQPWLSSDDAASAAGGASIMSQSGQVVETTSEGFAGSVGGVNSTNFTLGDSVIFAAADSLQDLRATVQLGTSVDVANQASGWSSPLMFYPDGSTSTAKIVIQNVRGRRIAITLRGITGATQIADMTPVSGVQ